MIAENIRVLTANIERKCRQVNRNPSEIKLVAVSKNFGVDDINSAYDLGITDFGENRAQELISKFEQIGNKVTWHFIGHLQKNKVKYVVRCADLIHSVDSLELAQEISKRAGIENKVQKVLIQVKTSDEETKSGIEDRVLLDYTVAFCVNNPNLELLGLMTMAPLTDDQHKIRKSFIELRELKNKFSSSGFSLQELSMGMTSDYEIAIEEGTTILRIGSAIFGERKY